MDRSSAKNKVTLIPVRAGKRKTKRFVKRKTTLRPFTFQKNLKSSSENEKSKTNSEEENADSRPIVLAAAVQELPLQANETQIGTVKNSEDGLADTALPEQNSTEQSKEKDNIGAGDGPGVRDPVTEDSIPLVPMVPEGPEIGISASKRNDNFSRITESRVSNKCASPTRSETAEDDAQPPADEADSQFPFSVVEITNIPKRGNKATISQNSFLQEIDLVKSRNEITISSSPKVWLDNSSRGRIVTSTPKPDRMAIKNFEGEARGLKSKRQKSVRENRIDLHFLPSIAESEDLTQAGNKNYSRNAVEMEENLGIDRTLTNKKQNESDSSSEKSCIETTVLYQRKESSPVRKKNMHLITSTVRDSDGVWQSLSREKALPTKRKNVNLYKERKRPVNEQELTVEESKLDTDVGVFLKLFNNIIDEFSSEAASEQELNVLRKFRAAMEEELLSKHKLLCKYYDYLKQQKQLSNELHLLSNELTSATMRRLRMEQRKKKSDNCAPIDKKKQFQDFVEKMNSLSHVQ